jgi:hypothetical protein
MANEVFEMRYGSLKEKAESWDYYQDLLNARGFEGITDLLAKYHQLEKVNREWKEVWHPINELVSPLTPLGQSVSLAAAKLIEERLKQIYG